jgi:hypothetical protein
MWLYYSYSWANCKPHCYMSAVQVPCAVTCTWISPRTCGVWSSKYHAKWRQSHSALCFGTQVRLLPRRLLQLAAWIGALELATMVAMHELLLLRSKCMYMNHHQC